MACSKRPDVRSFQAYFRSASPGREAFTLVELIVVITILAVLATVGFLALSGYTKDASSASVRANLKTVAQAVSTESSTLSESPRRYVSHSGGMVLSWAKFAGADLVPGPYGAVGTNYSAGTPNFSALRMDASKFRNPDGTPFYIGALDWTETLPSGKPRTRSFFQVAGFPESGISASGAVLVESSYPASLAGVGTSSGLIASSSGSSVSLSDTTVPAVPAAAAAAVSAWIAKMGGTSSDAVRSVAVDSSGNAYVIGVYYNSSTDGNGAKDFAGNQFLGVTTTAGMDAFVAKLDSSGTQQWIRKMGGTGIDEVRSVAVDSSGNAYVTGVYYNSSTDGNGVKDFAGNQLLGVTTTAGNDVFLIKLNSSGTQQWVITAGGTAADTADSVTVDSSWNVYVMGTYVNSTLDSWIARDFSGGSILGIGNTGNDVFLAKLNSSGTQQWIRTLGGTDANYARSVATDSSGNVYAFGTYVNTLTDNNVVKDFAGNQFLGVTSAAFSDVFLAKLNSSGTQQWIRKLGGTNGNDAARSIITDSSGNIYASGEYSNSSTDGSVAKDFAGNQLLGVTTVIGMDAFVAKLDSSGTQQWIRKMGGTGTDRAYSVAVNSSGNTYVAGHYFNSSTDGNGAKDFAGNQLLGVTTTAGNDAFLIKLDSSGTQQWVKKMGAFLGDIANAVTVHSDNVYAAGSYTCSDLCTTPDVMQDFAGNALPGVTSIFSTDAFVTLVAP